MRPPRPAFPFPLRPATAAGALLLVGASAALASAGGADGAPSITHQMAKLILQLGVILAAAKLAAEFCERVLRQPGVLGELAVGMVLGPHALGGSIPIPGAGEALFARAGAGPVPISTELYGVAQLAAVILLFLAGLETDLKRFLRYAGPATLVAAGGVALPFALGAWATALFGHAASWTDPPALFMGAIMTATSVGITARVLSDIGKLETSEGVTVLAGAVVDDVMGIIILAIVVNLASAGGHVDAAKIGGIAVKAIGFWLALTAGAIVFSKRIERAIVAFRGKDATMALAVALCFLAAAMSELAGGLAMIIGAYSMGLGLSSTEVKHYLAEKLEPVYNLLVPVFFTAMGMLVDFSAMKEALAFGAAVSLLAVLSKLLGCGLPALAVGFNRRGAVRIGIGMLPRGEVALIVAGVGLSSGVVGTDIFGVSIMMTMATTLLAPILLVPAFRTGGDGRRRIPEGERAAAAEEA